MAEASSSSLRRSSRSFVRISPSREISLTDPHFLQAGSAGKAAAAQAALADALIDDLLDCGPSRRHEEDEVGAIRAMTLICVFWLSFSR